MDDTYLALMHRSLDGDLQPDEQVRLDALLADDAEASTLAADLAVVVGALDRMEPRTPPPHLKDAIMAALPADRYAPAPAAPRSPSVWAILRDLVTARPRLALAYAFSVGLVLGIVGFGLLRPGTADPAAGSVAGTLAPPAEAPGPEVLAALAIDADETSGTVQLLASADGAVVRVALDAPADGEVWLAFPENAYSLRGFVREGGGADFAVTAHTSGVRVVPAGGRSVDLLFNEPAAATAPFVVTVARDGILYEQVLSPAP